LVEEDEHERGEPDGGPVPRQISMSHP
jgi:hypothetical protein